MWRQGYGQFVPFIATIAAVYFTDLLTGLLFGLTISIIFILYNNARIPYQMSQEYLSGQKAFHIKLAQELTFLNKVALLRSLKNIPDNSRVTIDASNTQYMHHDVQEILEDFQISARGRGIDLKLIGIDRHRTNKLPDHFKVSYNADGETVEEAASPKV
ncbi:MAG: hypothetical protein U5L96_00645 [Owenweeksia sp.]|nr:hypothetical protein [Owenweeksia sp.]